MTAPPRSAYDQAFPANPNRGRFAAWDIDAVAAGPDRVQVGVDVVLGGRTDQTASYLPCQSRGQDGEPDDPFYAACQTSSYYRFLTETTYPRGIFIGTEEEGQRHLWGQRVVTSALEIYPKILRRYDDGSPHPDGKGREVLLPDVSEFGRVRLATTTRRVLGRVQDAFPVRANGGSYTRPVGTVRLPRAGDAGVGVVNGYALGPGGRPAVRGEFHLSLFQQGSADRSSAGFPVASFGAGDNTNDKGFYTSGVLRQGRYDGNAVRYRLDAEGRATRIPAVHVRFTMRAPVPRLDFFMDRPDLGLSRYAGVRDVRFVVRPADR